MNYGTSYAIFPKRQKIYTNLASVDVQNITAINHYNNVVGYISYECYREIEKIMLPQKESFCNLPIISFSKFYDTQSFTEHTLPKETKIPKVKWIDSNFSKNEYLSSIKEIINLIKKGTCYQVNLTRKFFGEFEEKPNPLDIFSRLYGISPNPYSMLYVLDEERAVVSSSPECFLTRSSDNIYSMPIKGTINSKKNAEDLLNVKDKSENLMITDLVRNDIGRVSSKVFVEEFQKTETFSQVHHLHSKICGTLQSNITNADCIHATFPAGSMTGTPKIKAIEIANELEKMQRGIYSGCLGIIDDEQNFDFSVVIRTIILDGKKFEFQVGGAIVYDSTPEKELEETIIKAKPILETLGLGSEIFFR